MTRIYFTLRPSSAIIHSLFFSWILKFVSSIPIDNGLVGTPTIECGSDEFIVNFKTEKPFQGNVYAKGFFESDNCKVGATQGTDVSIKLKYNTLANCGVRRRRSTNPRGMAVEDTVVIMFHPLFLTKIDRAFRIECMYMESSKIVTHGLDVSMLTTQQLGESSEMPTCRYEVLQGGPNGSPIKFVQIGDMIYHKWTCEGGDEGTHCMVVHTCTVDDGQGTQRIILDEDGCAVDQYVLSNLEYITPLMAGRDAHVFKFADKPTLYFSCQIKMVPKDGDQCVRATCPDPTGFGTGTQSQRLQLLDNVDFPTPVPLPVDPRRGRQQRTILEVANKTAPAMEGAALMILNPQRLVRRHSNAGPDDFIILKDHVPHEHNQQNNTKDRTRRQKTLEEQDRREADSLDVDVSTEQITVLDILDSGNKVEFDQRHLGQSRRPFFYPDDAVVQITAGNFGLLMFALISLVLTTVASTMYAVYTKCNTLDNSNAKIMRTRQ